MWATCDECCEIGNVHRLVSNDLRGAHRDHGLMCLPCRNQIRTVMRLSGHSNIRVAEQSTHDQRTLPL